MIDNALFALGYLALLMVAAFAIGACVVVAMRVGVRIAGGGVNGRW